MALMDVSARNRGEEVQFDIGRIHWVGSVKCVGGEEIREGSGGGEGLEA
jgi:hypothetical protein